MEVKERIALLAHAFRHLFKIDQIEAKIVLRAQELDRVAPNEIEPCRAHASGEMARQQRGVVVADLRAEPGQAADRANALDRELEDEQNLAVELAADHNGGTRPACGADMTLPGRQALERCKHGAIAVALEGLPLRADLIKIAVQRKHDARARDSVRLARPCERWARQQRKLRPRAAVLRLARLKGKGQLGGSRARAHGEIV